MGRRPHATTTAQRAEIAHLIKLGHSATDIAEKLDMPVNSVYKHLQRMKERWEKETLLEMRTFKMMAVTALQEMKTEALDSWEQSKQPEITIKRRVQPVENNMEVLFEDRIEKNRSGTIQFLNFALQCEMEINRSVKMEMI